MNRLILFAIIWLAGVTAAPALDLEIQYPDTSRKYFPVADTSFFDVPYVSAEFLEHLFDFPADPVPERQKWIQPDFYNQSIYITVDNPYIVRDGEIYNLVYPARRMANHLYIPIQPTLKFLNHLYQIRAEYDSAGKIFLTTVDAATVSNSDTSSNLISIKKKNLPNGMLVEIEAEGPLKLQPLLVKPHFILSISGGILAPPLVKAHKWDTPLVKSVQGIQEKNLAQLTFTLTDRVDTVEAYRDPKDSAIIVSIRQKSSQPDQPKKEKAVKEKKVKTIIIDPGHGGKDPGAVVRETQEKKITLKVALLLKKTLAKRGYKVLLTRDKDTFIPLRDRPKFASQNSGDLFLSLHCNAIGGTPQKVKSVSGFVAYILRAGESEEDKTLARRENQAIEETKHKTNKDEISPVEWILLEHELNLYSHQSETFAEKIVKAFEKARIDKHRTGAHQAGFFVLVGAFMPAVLFEMGFITNDKDRAYLESRAGQKEIVEGLARAIDDFFEGTSNN